jgi:hypothetical protein
MDNPTDADKNGIRMEILLRYLTGAALFLESICDRKNQTGVVYQTMGPVDLIPIRLFEWC